MSAEFDRLLSMCLGWRRRRRPLEVPSPLPLLEETNEPCGLCGATVREEAGGRVIHLMLTRVTVCSESCWRKWLLQDEPRLEEEAKDAAKS
jgi:hypothetical protein